VRSSVQYPIALVWRFSAGLGAALVLLLTVAAASPAVHAWLHGHAEDEPHACAHQHEHDTPRQAEEAGCAVTLFSHGTLPLLVWQLPVLEQRLRTEHAGRLSESMAVAQPRYWLVPSHAPPVV
jgi:hypothetical protein